MKSLAFGEILWDIINGRPHLGGAPFNVAAHLAQLGGQSFMLSAVARDTLGNEAIARAQKLGVNTLFISRDSDFPTGRVDVTMKDGEPDYTIHDNVAWDFIPYNPDTKPEKEPWDVLIFGSLALRTEHNIQSLTTLMNHNTFDTILYDVNLRKNFYSRSLFEAGFSLCTILKMNSAEVKVVCKEIYGAELSENDFVKEVMDEYDIEVVLITNGASGAVVYTKDQQFQAKGEPVEVADTVGAGDSFSAAFIHTFHHKKDIKTALENACAMGGFVASHAGAIASYTPEITARFR